MKAMHDRRLVQSSSDSSSCSELALTEYPPSSSASPRFTLDDITTAPTKHARHHPQQFQQHPQHYEHRSSFDLTSSVTDSPSVAANRCYTPITGPATGSLLPPPQPQPQNQQHPELSSGVRHITRHGPSSAVALNRLGSAIGTPARTSSLGISTQLGAHQTVVTPTSQNTMYRLSSFNDHESSSVQSPDAAESELNMLPSSSSQMLRSSQPPQLAHSSTYETIDVRSLAQHYNPGTSASLEYASSSGSGTSSGPSQNVIGPDGFEDRQALFGARTHYESSTNAFFSRRPSMGGWAQRACDYGVSSSIYCSPNSLYSGVRIYDEHQPQLQQTSHLPSTPHSHHHPDHSSFHQRLPLPSRTADAGSVYSPLRKRNQPEEFTMLQALGTLISLTMYILTQSATFVLAFVYHRHRSETLMAYVTFAVLLLPSLLVNVLSLKWLLNDNNHQHQQCDGHHQSSQQKETLTGSGSRYPPAPRITIGPGGWTLRILLHICLLGPIFRYIELLAHGVKSWSVKRKIDQERQEDFLRSSLPSVLSTTMPRTRFLPGDGLPHFETAKRKGARQAEVDYLLLTIYEDRDCLLLSLFQNLPQCTLQCILQLCYFIVHNHRFPLTANPLNGVAFHHHLTDYLSDDFSQITEHLQVSVLLLSLISLSWSLTGHQLSISAQGGFNINLGAGTVTLNMIWNFGTIISRILAVSLFISAFGCWIVPVAILHWGIMTIAILHRQHLNEEENIRAYALHMIMAAINLVQLVAVTPFQAHLSATLFYTITVIENALFTGAWLWTIVENTSPESSLSLPIGLSLFVLGTFCVALICRQLYFWFAHRPSSNSTVRSSSFG